MPGSSGWLAGYDLAFDLCMQACERFNWYNRNTALNPFTVEGKKTAALEIGRQLGSDPPDVVVVPTGDGVIVSGLAKGFDDLIEAGLMTRRPRLLAVQPAGSAAIVRALDSGTATVEPVPPWPWRPTRFRRFNRFLTACLSRYPRTLAA